MQEEKKTVNPDWLHRDRFPKASRYDVDWSLANEMGPNALWLIEELTQDMDLEPGMRVLDLGSGRAMTSIFLAKEYGVRVWAADLWISAEDAWQQICDAGQQDVVCPLRLEAHNLPFAKDFFDAIISIDSYQYYGTDVTYLGYITRFLKTGGQLGLVMPALTQELDLEVPDHLTREQSNGSVFWDHSDCWTFKTLAWWRRHFLRTGQMDLLQTSYVQDGWQLWLDWERIRDGQGFSGFPSDAETIAEDGGRYLGFVKLVAKNKPQPDSPFDHSLLIRV